MGEESGNDPGERKSFLTAAIAHGDMSMTALVARITQASTTKKISPLQIIREYAPLAAGPGKLSPEDYLRLRLFDKEFYSDADSREFIGDARMRELTLAINFRRDWYALLSNKLASIGYLKTFEIPTIPVRAIYLAGAEGEGIVHGDKASLERFLLTKSSYPLFGKPAESQNSLGSMALEECDPATGGVVMGDGTRAKASELATEIEAKYAAGYLLQERMHPHPALAALCGDKLASVRFLTIRAEDGVQLFRVCLKIPVGNNMADNYWRAGNLLARLDMANGKIMSVTSGSGLETQEMTEHPDTKVPLIGFAYPEWEKMKALALKCGTLMRHVPLIGWDIACTDRGPVIVEMNEFPDAFLMQFSERRGLLDETFKRFAMFQNKARAEFDRNMKGR